jgi:hypothetical protein
VVSVKSTIHAHHSTLTIVFQDSAGERFCSGATVDREREGASLVSLNHPLTINFVKLENKCGNFSIFL